MCCRGCTRPIRLTGHLPSAPREEMQIMLRVFRPLLGLPIECKALHRSVDLLSLPTRTQSQLKQKCVSNQLFGEYDVPTFRLSRVAEVTVVPPVDRRDKAWPYQDTRVGSFHDDRSTISVSSTDDDGTTIWVATVLEMNSTNLWSVDLIVKCVVSKEQVVQLAIFEVDVVNASLDANVARLGKRPLGLGDGAFAGIVEELATEELDVATTNHIEASLLTVLENAIGVGGVKSQGVLTSPVDCSSIDDAVGDIDGSVAITEAKNGFSIRLQIGSVRIERVVRVERLI